MRAEPSARANGVYASLASLACALSRVPPAYEWGLRQREGSGCIATRTPGEKNSSARQIRLAGWLIFTCFTFQAHASSLGHVFRPSDCIFGVLRDTRGPTWPKQGCKFPRFSIENSIFLLKNRCGPNPALVKMVSMPHYPLWHVLSHVSSLRTSGGCDDATVRGASRHEL